MTNKKILQKAIEKAQKNGFNFQMIEKTLINYNFKEVENNNRFIWIGDNEIEEAVMLYELIFNHDFVKAFFGTYDIMGTEIRDDKDEYIKTFEAWQYHLQKMVLVLKPLKYLEKFL
jgi:hypothetical protein